MSAGLLPERESACQREVAMSLDNVPRYTGSARAGADVLERDLPPLPPLRADESDALQTQRADDELAEFVEFFTGEQRVVTAAPAPQPAVTPARHATPGQPGRLRRATERVIHVAAMRP